MFLRKTLFSVAALALALGASSSAFAADEKEALLRKLDVAAANFHTTSADFKFDSVQTDPIPDTDVQKGSIYFERKGHAFQMAAHIHEVNGKPALKIYGSFGGGVKYYDKLTNQVITSAKAAQFESYLMLGFGASGHELADKWDIKWLGTEVVDHVKTDRIELVAKDPAVRKLFPRVLVWIDAERGISLKLHFDEGAGVYRDCYYFNIKVNQALPPAAFTLPVDKQTTYSTR